MNNSGAKSPDSLAECAWRVLFPPRCGGCGLWCEELFCDWCRVELNRLSPPLCALCGHPFDALAQVLETSLCAQCRAKGYDVAPPLAALRAPLEYSGPIREAIHVFKYQGKTARADQLASLLADYLLNAPAAQIIPLENLKLVIPIPLHPWRKWRRGYNQSTLLANSLSQHLATAQRGTIAVAEVLRRIRYTTPQVALSASERERNIKGAFALDVQQWSEYSLSGEDAVLLIDDVGTTGATFYECARVLTRSTTLTADRIYALCLARDL